MPTSPPLRGTFATGAADNSAGNPDGPNDAIVAWPPPPPPATDSNLFGDAPTGTTATTPSSISSNDIVARPGGQPLAADEGKVGSEPAPDDEPNAAQELPQPTNDDARLEKDIGVASNKASYKAISFAMLSIIAASSIFVGIMLNRTLAAMARLITVTLQL